jgi:protoporphyrinogen oxidase
VPFAEPARAAMTAARTTAVIIGAGPAGLTAALQLLRQTGVHPIVLEASAGVGGISRTVNFRGNRMDIGGHRFFSRSDWVMDWWQQILPFERPDPSTDERITIAYRNQRRDLRAAAPSGATARDADRVMLVRDRLSRIYFLGKFFAYPIKLDFQTLANLGPWRVAKAGFGYLRAVLFPRHPERTLEDFLVNRFGVELYRTFFKEYTEKVWGVPCTEISAEWGAQRIKGVSLTGAVLHALRQMARGTATALPQDTQTSLVEHFLYPKLGPGQLWEEVANLVRERGGEIRHLHAAEGLAIAGDRVTAVRVRDLATGAITTIAADYVISTMPVKDLVAAFDPPAPADVRRIAAALPYRDFVTVGVIASRMKGASVRRTREGAMLLPDNWIYVQDPQVRLGRLQIFNNWSPALAADPAKAWLGLEYFCAENDDLWRLSDEQMRALAVRELAMIGLVDPQDVEAATVIRVPKAYPAYFGTHAEFATIRNHVDALHNLFLIGRNGMHRYNNQDHSMLTAKAAVDNIAAGLEGKDNIWSVNVDDDYHEQRQAPAA